jgi:hypothetical protein
MRSMKVKAAIASTLLLLGFTTMAAEAVLLSGSLGSSMNATDIFSVQCGVGTSFVGADVDDFGGFDGVSMRVTVLDLRGRADSRVAPDYSFPSEFAVLSGGPGHYLVIIQKAADVAPLTSETYQTMILCENSAGVSTATSVLLIQNK